MTERERNIHRAWFRALAVSLGLDPEGAEASRRILRAWGERQPPQVSRETDLVFYDFSPDPGEKMYTERSIRRRIPEISRFLPCRLTLFCYGPGALSLALRARDNLFLDGAGMPRRILRRAGIYPVPEVRPPALLREEEDGLYRQRADLVISAWMLENVPWEDREHPEVPPVEIPPEIRIHGKEG